MHARPAHETEADIVVEMGRSYQLETAPHLDYDRDVARATFRQYLETSNPTVFVVEDENRQVIGFSVARFHDYDFTKGHFLSQEALFVVPDKRDTPAAALLAEVFTRWALRTKPREIFSTAGAGADIVGTAEALTQRLGFKMTGAVMRFVPERSDG